MKTPCPNCNSPQEFRHRYKAFYDLVEVYIKCTMCRKTYRINLITEAERKTALARARQKR